jgi:hypothetical protein
MAGFLIKRDDGSIMGPFDQQEIRRLIGLRKIGPDTLITQEGRRTWFRLRDVPALAREWIVFREPPELEWSVRTSAK